jgi:hypothetical protein
MSARHHSPPCAHSLFDMYPVNTQVTSTQPLVLALVRRRVRARANILVPRPGGAPAADAPAAHAAAHAPVIHAARGVVAVPHLTAQPAGSRCVVGAAEGAAAPLPHARDGFRVALPGSSPDVLAGEAHVHVAEDTFAKHLAELVLGLLDVAVQGEYEGEFGNWFSLHSLMGKVN